MSFASLGLSDALTRAVADLGYQQPTPIQLQAIPAVLSGGDLLAAAQTGTGKTAGFVLPILQRLTPSPRSVGMKRPRVLIMAPTRELAAQVEQSVREYGKYLPFKSAAIFGGVGMQPQIDALRKGLDILVATPGRLLDHHRQRTVDLTGVQTLVLDEADRMLDMGFLPDIRRVLALLPRQRQNLLFSATFPDPIQELAKVLLKSPAVIQATPRNSTVDAVQQVVHPVDATRKADLLVHLIQSGQWFQVLVFTRTKHGANRLATRLEKSGIGALAIHGNKSQGARTRALEQFKQGALQVLVATDIAARGLDIEQLPHVVNFDLPNVPEDYVHRIGRTGRAGAGGEAVSLASAEEATMLRDIERLIKRSIPRRVVEGFEAGSRSRNDHHVEHTAPRPAGRNRTAGSTAASKPRRPDASSKPRRPDASSKPRRPDASSKPRRPDASSKPRRPDAGKRGKATTARAADASAQRRGVDSPMVRSNLPPGWTIAPPGRRER
jgi:ATP-dependent RNA helicase RhlE